MMPEALTESFCERCGTRYEFTAPTELNRMAKTRGLISGLKNYIMSQDALGDAVGDAMRSEEEALASQQLEAFHESFNFCINCRQYTCLNCWNDDAGRCRTCVPVAGTDDLLERFEHSFHAQHPEIAAAAVQAEMEQAEINRRLGLEHWPSEDLGHAGANGAEPAWPDAELEPMMAEIAPDAEPDLEPMVAEAEPEPVVAEAAMAAAAIDGGHAGDYPPLRVLSWEEDTAIELEPEPVAAEVEPEAVVAEVEPEPVVAEAAPAPEPEPVAAEGETEPDAEVAAAMAAFLEPEPALPAPQPIRPISETILTIPQQPTLEAPGADADRVAAQADDPSLAARKAQLDLLGIGDPGQGTVGPDRSNVLPYRSTGASVSAREMAMRTASGLPAPAAFWEASAREVAGAMSHVGVHACSDCGLSLSASARFCRRCGTRQAQPA
jgi:hypothetical protein